MKKLSEIFNGNKESFNSNSVKAGSYSTGIIVIITAILITLNILVTSLPSSLTQLDISAAKLYSLSSGSKVVINNLDKDVTIYWVCQAGKEDSVIEKLVKRYADSSDHITLVRKDPDIYPTFVKQYTDEAAANNSLIIECGERYRYIGYDNIYLADQSAVYTTGSAAYSFDGEGAVTSAIGYVTSDELPQVYVLTGHDEEALADSIKNTFERENVELKEYSLLTAEQVDENAAMILINAPKEDISETERDMLQDYMDNGGHLLIISGAQDSRVFENLLSLVEPYGITSQEGIVIDTDRDHYAFSSPYMLLPTIQSSDITSVLLEGTHYALVPLAQGFTLSGSTEAEVTSLLDSSSVSYLKKAGYQLETYDKEDGDVDGPFSVAFSVKDEETQGSMVWFGTSYMLDESYNSYSANTNVDLVINAMNWMIERENQISIHSKSLGAQYLTITDTEASRLKVVMIFVLPAIFLACGIDEVIRRRKK